MLTIDVQKTQVFQRLSLGCVELNKRLCGGMVLGTFSELIPSRVEWDDASVSTLTAKLLARLQDQVAVDRPMIWITQHDTAGAMMSPMGLVSLGLDPDNLVQVVANNDVDALWAAEEALYHPHLSAVVVEVCDLNLQQSHRLNLRAKETANAEQCRLLLALRRSKGARHPQAMPTSCHTRMRVGASRHSNAVEIDVFRQRGGAPLQGLLKWSAASKRFEFTHQQVAA